MKQKDEEEIKEPYLTLTKMYDYYADDRQHWAWHLDKASYKEAIKKIFAKINRLIINEKFVYKFPIVGGYYLVNSRRSSNKACNYTTSEEHKKEITKNKHTDGLSFFFYYRRSECKNSFLKKFYKLKSINNQNDPTIGRTGLNRFITKKA